MAPTVGYSTFQVGSFVHKKYYKALKLIQRMLEKDFLSNWKEVNAVTCSLIKAVPGKKLYCKPFQPRFKSLAWEFSCILSTRLGYIQGIKVGKLVESCFVEDNENIARLDKNQMLKQVNQTDIIIQKLIEKSKNKEKLLRN